MEVVEMEDKKSDSHMTSAVAFVEGGLQETLDDACSICLENFCESDPSTMTTCKHEFHLQCILEWCQRSSQCPMCWKTVALIDPSSQEFLEAVESERELRVTPSRNAAIFHHPALGDFGLQNLPVGLNDASIDERIIQHLAAAAAMGRAHSIGRREGYRTRSSPHGRPHFLVISSQPSPPPHGTASAVGGETEPHIFPIGSPCTPLTAGAGEPSRHVPRVFSLQTQRSSSAAGHTVTTCHGILSHNRSASQSYPPNTDRSGPSEFQSFSESLKSRFNSVSMRYKESISKSTRGWKERLFCSSSMSDIGSEVRREVNAGIASVSHLIGRLDSRVNNRAGEISDESNHLAGGSITEIRNPNHPEGHRQSP